MEGDPEASVMLGQPGVVLDSAQPREDGTGWCLGVWMSVPGEVWGFDENSIRAGDRGDSPMRSADAQV
jgi:hypothetical protein